MKDNMEIPSKLVGKTLFCTATQQNVKVIEHATDFISGAERFEGYRVQYPNGETYIIALRRVGRDYLPTYPACAVREPSMTTLERTFQLRDLFAVEAHTPTPYYVFEQEYLTDSLGPQVWFNAA